MEHMDHHGDAESSAVEYAKFVGVLSLVVLAAYFISSKDGFILMDFMRWTMGLFLITLAGFKIAGYKMFVMMFPTYDLVAKRFKLYAQAYPFIELGLGLLFILNLLPGFREIAIIIIMSVGEAGIIKTIFFEKRKIKCACLGNIIKLPLSTTSSVEDIGMVLMAVYMLAIM